nr:NADP-dependent malic enzyme [uncultured Mucilaginibacter sp.]
MTDNNKTTDALDYHAMGRPGKIEVIPTKPYRTQRDLSLAYSPGVAEPCLRIAENEEDAYKYTAKGNLVAVISNGTAVLGLGDIGAQAGKPVMEGKGLLFKIFADIDVFDLELDTKNIDEFVNTVKILEPTFGGINLEDIKAPECFEIERRLKAEMNIPVMHDDQHGTAIISSAALINACEIQEKDISKVKIVINGAGAAAISCARLYLSVGAKKENIVMLDRKGVIRADRADLEPIKSEFATNGKELNTLDEAIKGADVFIGLSSANTFSPEMLLSMAANPIVFAMANPDPEIAYDLAVRTRDDVIMATGRSDFPNQVNNVLGFPFIFRGALDVRARAINEEMKIAAVYAIAELVKKPVPESVTQAYNVKHLTFGKEYIIPKPMDPRLISTVSPAVAKAAIASGVARKVITDWDAYEEELHQRMGVENVMLRALTNKAKSAPKRVVFAEADNYKILKAAQIVKDEGIAIPILLGNKERIQALMNENNLDLDDVQIFEPALETEKLKQYAEFLYRKRQRKGMSRKQANKLILDRNYFGASMVQFGDADALISGITMDYAVTVKPALQIIGTKPSVKRVAGIYMMLTKRGPIFLGDTSINKDPSVDELVDITVLVNDAVKKFNVEPRIAIISYSNFGSTDGKIPEKTAEVVRVIREKYPDIVIDGEMQVNFALNPKLLEENFDFSTLKDAPANTLVFPNLESGNVAYKILQELGEAEAIGPILLGLNKPVHVLQMGSTVREIVNMVNIAVIDAQSQVG